MNLHVLPSTRGISRTDIEWADYAVGSPFRFRDKGTGQVYPTACVKVSDGCKNCYAESIGERFRTYLPYTKPNMDRLECFLDQGVIDHVLSFKPRPPKGEATFKNGRSRPAVFFGDTTDIFGEWVTFEQLDALFACFALRPDVDFLLLTKRPERMAEYLTQREISRAWSPSPRGGGGCDLSAKWKSPCDKVYGIAREWKGRDAAPNLIWPLPNVWLGCSVEDQKTADERIPHLLKCPAAVRFLSVEPQVGDIEYRDEWASGIHWMIGGGESGHGARPYDIAWPRKGIAWAKRHRIAWFQKQLGLRPFLADHAFCPQCLEWRGVDGLDVAGLGDQLECRECHKRKRTKTGQPQRMPSGKGSDPSEWPTDLRVRQVPGGAA